MEEKRESSELIVVGYALEAKKVDSFIKDSLVSYATSRGVHFVPVDLNKPLVEQGPFHCVIHKLYGDDWHRQLLDFRSRHPDTLIVDSPDAILRLHHRTSMLDAVAAVSHSLPIAIPNQTLLLDHHAAAHFPAGFRFPAIAKPLAADGGADCHEMCLVFDAAGLKKVEPPVVVQEFVNHGGVVYKIYVAGDHVRCVSRPSLPDVSPGGAADGAVIPFSRVSNSPVAVDKPEGESTPPPSPPPDELVNEVARGLRKELKLNLFNLDLIRDSNTDKFLVIDINYFPGYAKLPGFEELFTNFLLDVCHPST